MEKTKTEIIYEHLLNQSLSSSELENETSIPKTTLFRALNIMISDKIIRKTNGKYSVIIPTPSIQSIIDKMLVYHQQKLMNYKYRRFDRDKQVDIITEWYIDNIKGKIEDYDFENLLDHITIASTHLKNKL